MENNEYENGTAEAIVNTEAQELEIETPELGAEEGVREVAPAQVNQEDKTTEANPVTISDVKLLINKALLLILPKLGLRIQKVDELPDVGENGIIYLVPISGGTNPNLYEEYYWVDSTTGFELMGTTEIDLSSYVDLTSAQTITGVKTFSNDIKVNTSIIKEDNGSLFLQGASGVIKLNGTTRPTTNGTRDLGNSSYCWKDLYLTGKIQWSSNTYTYLDNNGNFNIWNGAGSVRINTNFRPDSDNSRSMGNSANRWKDLYIGGSITDGTNSVAVADLAALITYAKTQGWIQ